MSKERIFLVKGHAYIPVDVEIRINAKTPEEALDKARGSAHQCYLVKDPHTDDIEDITYISADEM